MNLSPVKTGCGICAAALLCLSLRAASAQTTTSRIVSAANKFLSALDDKQRQTVLFAFDDEKQRKRWSNFPIAMVPRAGIGLREMNTSQRTAAMALVASALSPRGLREGPADYGGRRGQQEY